MAKRDELIKQYNTATVEKKKVYEELAKVREQCHMVACPTPDAEKKFRAAEKAYAEAHKKVEAIRLELAK